MGQPINCGIGSRPSTSIFREPTSRNTAPRRSPNASGLAPSDDLTPAPTGAGGVPATSGRSGRPSFSHRHRVEASTRIRPCFRAPHAPGLVLAPLIASAGRPVSTEKPSSPPRPASPATAFDGFRARSRCFQFIAAQDAALSYSPDERHRRRLGASPATTSALSAQGMKDVMHLVSPAERAAFADATSPRPNRQKVKPLDPRSTLTPTAPRASSRLPRAVVRPATADEPNHRGISGPPAAGTRLSGAPDDGNQGRYPWGTAK